LKQRFFRNILLLKYDVSFEQWDLNRLLKAFIFIYVESGRPAQDLSCDRQVTIVASELIADMLISLVLKFSCAILD